MSRIDAFVKEKYDGWVNDAPAAWKKCRFLEENKLCLVSCLYGQNQPIMVQNGRYLDEEARSWSRMRDFSKMRSLTVAIATRCE